MLFDVFGDVFAGRHVKEFTCFLSFVPFDPGVFRVVESGESVGDNFERFRAFTNTDDVAGDDLVGCDVYDLAVDGDVTVEYELACCGACGSDAETVNYVVEA